MGGMFTCLLPSPTGQGLSQEVPALSCSQGCICSRMSEQVPSGTSPWPCDRHSRAASKSYRVQLRPDPVKFDLNGSWLLQQWVE